jgi:hypothetical protein
VNCFAYLHDMRALAFGLGRLLQLRASTACTVTSC